ncbi:MAG: hypothetical protein IJW17_00540 [Lentisphaeria bacterium]|nr:hypothetical protein [Lentisphaeria bacterium]
MKKITIYCNIILDAAAKTPELWQGELRQVAAATPLSIVSIFVHFYSSSCEISPKNLEKVEKKFKNGLQSFCSMLYYIPVAPQKGLQRG